MGVVDDLDFQMGDTLRILREVAVKRLIYRHDPSNANRVVFQSTLQKAGFSVRRQAALLQQAMEKLSVLEQEVAHPASPSPK